MPNPFPTKAFLNSGLEVPATITTVAGGPAIIQVHYWNEFEAMRIAELEYDSTNPLARVIDTDLNGADQNDRLLVNEINYWIKDLQPDGYGFTLLILSLEEN